MALATGSGGQFQDGRISEKSFKFHFCGEMTFFSQTSSSRREK
jgi:hypothetical protein